MSARRFELNEAKAAEWLALCVAAEEGTLSGAAGPLAYSPGIDADWTADLDEHETIENLLEAVRVLGILTTPQMLTRVHLEVDSGGEGYRWLVCLDPEPGPGQSLWLATAFEASPIVGGDGARGAAAGLVVLREAVASANECLDDLDAYAASVRPAGGR